MKKMFLLIVLPVLLVTFGFGQTMVPSSNGDQASLKGCLGGAEGKYTVAEDGTTQIFKVTSSTVDLKPHVGHDVEIIGQKATAATSSSASDKSVVITGVNMISEHCATATASTPATADPTPSATASTPAADATPTATASTPAVADATPSATASTPAVADATPSATTSTPAADATPSATASTPAADQTPSATASTPAVADATPAATASAPVVASAPAPESTERMPDTASPLPLLALLGFGLLTAGLLSRKLWTN
jgi:hypothetical protein